MGKKIKTRRKEPIDIGLRNFELGSLIVSSHPIFEPLLFHADIRREEKKPASDSEYAKVSATGQVYCYPKIRAEPEEWAHIIAHCLLHLGMEHFDFAGRRVNPIDAESLRLWNCACDLVIEGFLQDLKLGKPPGYPPALPGGVRDEEKLFERFAEQGLSKEYAGFGTAGFAQDMIFTGETVKLLHWRSRKTNWTAVFAAGLAQGVLSAVDVAGGAAETLKTSRNFTHKTPAQIARSWFISSYPLIGAVASVFKIIEDTQVCGRMDIRIAAVSASMQEVYINPAAGLTAEEYRFVLAHEFLHAALRHDARCDYRDAYLWNVACDYVINHWLTEMNVGERPPGCLYDEQFKGLSAEAVYDRITSDMRTFRKAATLRGLGLGDILPGNAGGSRDGVDLDEFYRRALSEGLSYHQDQGRGYLPEGLIEEIRALAHPPIPWDVELARWFDDMFTPIEKLRTYARPSRRQSATPDIPRPNWFVSKASLDGRTFGVILDTSGSMERALLAEALGAIASYSASRDVPAARVVFCDADGYDQGYMKPEDIAGTVKVKGRGGTVLQPGVDLLVRAEDFPPTAPILIITDGGCEDRLHLYGREHAYLLPAGAHLPFIAQGKVFRVKKST
jgi:predicted metal-dependent peptidase